MNLWPMGKKKKEDADAKAEPTALEKRLAEKAAKEAYEENAPDGPKTLKEAAEQIEELNGRILRITAEQDNYRKRVQREKDEARQFANQGLIEKQLPILDNFEMALAAAADADPAIRDGVKMILDQLLTVLKEAGVEPIDAEGKLFDPNFHEAISQLETTESEEGTVLQQVQRGFLLHDRLVRPARVVVAKAPVAADEPADD